jgi:hypothetical protein
VSKHVQYQAFLTGVFCLVASASAAEVEGDGAKLSLQDAQRLFEEVCVLNDARSSAPKKAAKNLGFVGVGDETLYSAELNAEVNLRSLNGAGICEVVFLPEGSDSTYQRGLGKIQGMKPLRGGAGYKFNGNGQRQASYLRLGSEYPSAARAYLMIVGANADDFDN